MKITRYNLSVFSIDKYRCSLLKNYYVSSRVLQNLFEQIWAANEYEIFKRMMIQKNLELQLQALNMIEQKYGLTPASLVYETDGILDDELVMEDLIQYVISQIYQYTSQYMYYRTRSGSIRKNRNSFCFGGMGIIYLSYIYA